MVDVHIIHMPHERADWWRECEASLHGQPITIHHIVGVPGDVRQGRLNGYQLGHHDYVSYVDPDDIVMPGAFEKLLDAVKAHPSVGGAYSLSDRIDQQGKSMGLIHPYREYSRNYLNQHVAEIHQLAVTRRECILDTLQEHYDQIPPMAYTEITYFAMFSRKYDWVAVDHVGYAWRIHAGGAHNCSHAERMSALNKIREIQLDLTSTHRAG